MPKYDHITWSHGYNQERHPKNPGGDGLAFFLWDGEPGDDLENATYGASVEENGGHLIGWVYVDYNGDVSARFEEHERDRFDKHILGAFEWCEQLNAQGGEL